MKGDALVVGVILAIVVFSASSGRKAEAEDDPLAELSAEKRADLIKRAATAGRTPEAQLKLDKRRGY